jgi:secreted Zn-dependent insulinase-like peptidase
LGHEGSNSAFAVLQEEGLLSSLSAGARHSGPDFTLFQVSVDTPPAGSNKVDLSPLYICVYL